MVTFDSKYIVLFYINLSYINVIFILLRNKNSRLAHQAIGSFLFTKSNDYLAASTSQAFLHIKRYDNPIVV